MKRITTVLLIVSVMAAFAACGKKAKEETAEAPENIVETIKPEENAEENKEETADKQEDKKEDKEEAKKPENAQTPKPSAKPQTEQKPTAAPENKPAENPVERPAEKPVEKPVEKPAEPAPDTSTLGKTLLADFKTKASSGMSAQEIADGLLTNPAIKFSGGAMPIEEGLLSGFDNAEIKGFKSGVMFAPMIGSIAFVGYIFELENAADAPAFIANLEKNANRRWNICVEAEETVTGSVGNKVFFVMCPKSLEE